jgi:hypothetical protein
LFERLCKINSSWNFLWGNDAVAQGLQEVALNIFLVSNYWRFFYGNKHVHVNYIGNI